MTCGFCQQPFPPRLNRHRRYCGPVCHAQMRAKAMRARRVAVSADRSCAHCHGPMAEQWNALRRYCCDQCKRRASEARRPIRPPASGVKRVRRPAPQEHLDAGGVMSKKQKRALYWKQCAATSWIAYGAAE